jgi:type III secretion system low calcium response chaperone LcrH/SycD
MSLINQDAKSLNLSESDVENFFSYLTEMVLQAGGQPGEVMQISEEEQRAYYTLAHTLYEQSRYDESAKVFAFLVVAFPREGRYYKGMGACYQMMQNYKKASELYALAGWWDPLDIMAYFHLGECCTQLGKIDDARACFEMVSSIAEDDLENEVYQSYALRAHALLDRIKQIKRSALAKSKTSKSKEKSKKS